MIRENGCGRDQVLAVVDHKQEALRLQIFGQRFYIGLARLLANSEAAADPLGNELWF